MPSYFPIYFASKRQTRTDTKRYQYSTRSIKRDIYITADSLALEILVIIPQTFGVDL